MSNINNGQDNPHHARARAEMVERLRRHYHIRDERVLAAMARIPRHLFVPEALQSHAYGDHALPIEFNQTISQPYIVARQTELLEVTRTTARSKSGPDRSGQLCSPPSRARPRARAHPRTGARGAGATEGMGIYNVTVKCFDGTYGWNEFAPFRAILVAAAAPDAPKPSSINWRSEAA